MDMLTFANYDCSLDPSNGLFLELYHGDRITTINGPYTFFHQYLDIRPTLLNSNRALNINWSTITSST